MRITIKASTRGKVPSVYVGKTFDVVQVTKAGDELPTCRKNDDGTFRRATWDAYEGITSTGRKISFTHYQNNDWEMKLIVHREGFARGTWIPEGEYEISE